MRHKEILLLHHRAAQPHKSKDSWLDCSLPASARLGLGLDCSLLSALERDFIQDHKEDPLWHTIHNTLHSRIRSMRWNAVLFIFCTVTVASSSAFVSIDQHRLSSTPSHHFRAPNVEFLARDCPKSSPIHFTSSNSHTPTQLNAARTLAVAGRIPWEKFVLDLKQRTQFVSIVRKETHVLDISLVSCHLCKYYDNCFFFTHTIQI